MNPEPPAPDVYGFKIRIVALLSGLRRFLSDLLGSRSGTFFAGVNSRICWAPAALQLLFRGLFNSYYSVGAAVL